MKERIRCKTCKTDVKPVAGNTEMIEGSNKTVCVMTEYACPSCNGIVEESDIVLSRFTLEECIEIHNRVKNAEPHPDLGHDYGKIGDVKKCRECNKITNVCTHAGLTYDIGNHKACDFCKTSGAYEGYDEAIGGGIMWSERIYDQVCKLFEKICERVPPTSDSIMEFERIVWFVDSIHDGDDKCSTKDYEMMIKDKFINKCAELGLIRK